MMCVQEGMGDCSSFCNQSCTGTLDNFILTRMGTDQQSNTF